LAFYYLETSALVKLYVRESGTERVLALANRISENRLAILGLTQVELRSAVRRRERNGEISPLVATQLLETFKRHVETRFVSQTINDFVLDVASALVDRHALRAYDAIQLAGYVALRGSTGTEVPVFVCSDHALLEAARLEGIPVLDPALGP
jgi:predicted nucleic acid-binding protein